MSRYEKPKREILGSGYPGDAFAQLRDKRRTEALKEGLNDLQEQIDGVSGFTPEFVIAFSNFLDHMSSVFDDSNGQTYVDALKNALQNALQNGESSDGINIRNGVLRISENATVIATQSGSTLTLA